MNKTLIQNLTEKYQSNAIDIAENLELAKVAVEIREDIYEMIGRSIFVMYLH